MTAFNVSDTTLLSFLRAPKYHRVVIEISERGDGDVTSLGPSFGIKIEQRVYHGNGHVAVSIWMLIFCH